jgi:hypothetical protein
MYTPRTSHFATCLLGVLLSIWGVGHCENERPAAAAHAGGPSRARPAGSIGGRGNVPRRLNASLPTHHPASVGHAAVSGLPARTTSTTAIRSGASSAVSPSAAPVGAAHSAIRMSTVGAGSSIAARAPIGAGRIGGAQPAGRSVLNGSHAIRPAAQPILDGGSLRRRY